jgi:cytochrome c biogenesis protein CcdA
MPCVFPVLSMKAASLASHAHDQRETRRQGLAFLAGVLATFLGLAGLLLAAKAGGAAIGWGFQLQSPTVVGALALIMLLVALNLSGVFEANLPGQNAGGSLASKSGLVGAFFTGALAVVVAAPCTAPFMATALGFALTQSAPGALLVFLGLGLGFAAPFVAVAFIPGLLRRLPRPGAWMDALRHVLAFPMYGTAAWLLWVFTLQAGSSALASLLAASVLVGLFAWLIGATQRVGKPLVPGVFAVIAAGLAVAFLYYLHARKMDAPLLDFTLMKLPCFGLSFTAMMLFRTGIGAIPFLLPMMLQVGFGDAAVESGLITFASSAGALVMKPAAQYALRIFGFRDTLIWNGVFSGIMLMMCALFRPTWPAAAIYLVLLVGGFLRSLQFTAYNTLAYGDVPRSQMSAATSLYTAGQQLAATVGVSVGALALELARTMSHHLTPENSDFSAAFVVVGLMTLAAAPIAFFMPLSAGDDLTGRHAAEAPTPAPVPASRTGR